MKSVFFLIFVFAIIHSNSVVSQSWTEAQKIVASDREQNDFFGVEVDIDGNRAICGAERKGLYPYAGAAYVFEHIGDIWSESQKLVNPFPFSYDYFGQATAISGDYAVVSAYRDDEDENEENYLMNSGSAFIYERAGDGTWNLVQKIAASDRTENAWYGISVAIDGTTITIGAQYERYDGDGINLVYGAGAVYIYDRSETGVWNETQKIAANVRATDDLFGSGVGVSGDKILVGAYKEEHDENEMNSVTDTGAGYVFEKDELGTWSQVAKLVAFDREPYDSFGLRVALDGDVAVLGAWGEDEDENGLNEISFAGSAYIFERSSPGVWGFSQKIVASDRENNANFGLGLDVSGDIILVGARYETEDVLGENDLEKAGAAYFYEKDMNGAWAETQKVVSSDRHEYDYFGQDVGISGTVSIVGAYPESEDENGLNTLNTAGSAYIFDYQSCIPSLTTDTISACDSLEWINGLTYYASNSNTSFLTFDELGCDSLVSLSLEINYSSASQDSLVVCDSLSWINGQTYFESNYNDSFLLQTMSGCDSLVQLNLTIIEIENLIFGCTYPFAVNYNTLATMEDGTCLFEGCTDPEAINFNPMANLESGDCVYSSQFCANGTMWDAELEVCVPESSECIGDLNNDQAITASDLSIFLAVFGTSCD